MNSYKITNIELDVEDFGGIIVDVETDGKKVRVSEQLYETKNGVRRFIPEARETYASPKTPITAETKDLFDTIIDKAIEQVNKELNRKYEEETSRPAVEIECGCYYEGQGFAVGKNYLLLFNAEQDYLMARIPLTAEIIEELKEIKAQYISQDRLRTYYVLNLE